ncbi:MAG TPA: hypothetical protein VF860_01215 [Candidatus Acidoferrales bacterium]
MYEPRVTEYLNSHPSEQESPAEEILWKITKPPYAPPLPEHRGPASGPPTGGKYGIDGEFWREIPPSGRLGIIQGFLYCYSKYERGSKGTFSKSPSWYVEAISKWYGVTEADEGLINPRRANVGIPYVLFKFRDTNGH